MSEKHASPQDEQNFHTYTTHSIPWYVRGIWVAFWIGMMWYLIVYAVPMAKNYFK